MGEPQPIGCQYPGNVITVSQSEARIRHRQPEANIEMLSGYWIGISLISLQTQISESENQIENVAQVL